MSRENDESTAIVPARGDSLSKQDVVGALLSSIRPAWRSRSLVERVSKILPVDPSSACQRILNAAIHDLREKVIIAGLDIAKEAAKTFGLPSVETAEDAENYSTSKLLDLSYRMGLLTRAEWRRLHRAYEIRRDLEHEDDEYEAGLEDCVYIFKTSIEIVLARDPVQPLRINDVKEIVENKDDVSPGSELLADYERAPQPRQLEICKYLISTALESKQPDIIRQNSVEMLRHLAPITQGPVRLSVAAFIQEKIGRKGLDLACAKVAHAIGAIPYLKQAQIQDFFTNYFARMNTVGHHWTSHAEHGKLLADLEDFGGLENCPDSLLDDYLEWLILAYIGKPGGYGMGINRPVFFSNSAAPVIRSLMTKPPERVKKKLEQISKKKTIQHALINKYISRRLDDLLDLSGD